MFRCPYYWEEGGGQEGYQNVLIFYVLIKGGREGVEANKDNVLICALFFIEGIPYWMVFSSKRSHFTLISL